MTSINNDTPSEGTKAGIFDKVAKLLRKAEDPSITEAEREAFMAKAAELMAKYGIDRAFAAAGRPSSDEMVIKEWEFEDVNTARAEATLLYRLLEALRSKAIFLTTRGTMTIECIGYLSDIERAEVQYTSLSLQMAQAVDRERPYSWASYMLGWINGAVDLVKAAEKRAQDEAEADPAKPGVALVLQDRSVAVRNAFEQEHPKTSKMRRASLDPSSYLGGYAAGQRANIGGTGVGGGSRTALAG